MSESRTGFRLADAPEGYDLCAVTTPSGLFIAPETEASLRVYGDAALADPYTGPLVGAILLRGGPPEALELGTTEAVDLGGTTGLLGGGDGFIGGVLPPEAGRVLTWQWDDERIVQVVVRNDTTTDLVALADAVVVEGTEVRIDTSVIPADTVDLGDLYELEARPQFRFSLDYQRRGEDGSLLDQVTLLGAAGDEASMNAFRFRAEHSQDGDEQIFVTFKDHKFSIQTRPNRQFDESARNFFERDWPAWLTGQIFDARG